jgi:hypothetical protein
VVHSHVPTATLLVTSIISVVRIPCGKFNKYSELLVMVPGMCVSSRQDESLPCPAWKGFYRADVDQVVECRL